MKDDLRVRVAANAIAWELYGDGDEKPTISAAQLDIVMGAARRAVEHLNIIDAALSQ